MGDVLGRTYEGQNCSIARTLEVVGERWTLLILRDACVRDVRRFVDFQRSLGVARNVLAARLQRLCEHGLLERRPYREGSELFEYHPTQQGLDLFPVLASLMRWGDRYLAESGPPGVLVHTDCGGEPDHALTCMVCGQQLGALDVQTRPGPGATADTARTAAI
jgi:DNA-binding HxlR family transcriptional regulator